MFSDMIRAAAELHGDRPAIIFGDRHLTHRQVYERACRLANLLLESGVKPGDGIATLGRNQISSFDDLGAVALGGFVRSPLYLQDSPQRQAFMLQRVQSAALIVDAACWPPLAEALGAEGIAALKLILVRDGGSASGVPGRDYEAALASSSAQDPHSETDPDRTYVIRFSAGTTGMPKPIAHSERAYCLANEEVLSNTAPLAPDDVYLAVSPYSHASGNLIWPFIRAGASHILMSGGFDADTALDLIERHRVTTLFLVPTMIQRLLSSPRCASTDLSSVRRIVYGAAPIPQDLIRRALDTFGDVLSQSYGQSEIVPITCLTPDDHRAEAEHPTGRLASAGRATPNTGVRIEGPDGAVLGVGEIGQIVGRSPGAMQGIYGDSAATAERITADGWVRTGDLGRLDDAGYLFVVDRMDDIIISGGFNIAPSEIEDALNLHPDVVEAVAFGMPDPKWGSAPVAVVRLESGSSLGSAALIEWCREHVGPVKKPARVLVVQEALPVNPAGKLMRRVAKDVYADRI